MKQSLLLVLLLFVFAYLAVELFQNPEGTRFRCPTRNMSYDLRGDILISPDRTLFPSSAIGPDVPQNCVYRKNWSI